MIYVGGLGGITFRTSSNGTLVLITEIREDVTRGVCKIIIDGYGTEASFRECWLFVRGEPKNVKNTVAQKPIVGERLRLYINADATAVYLYIGPWCRVKFISTLLSVNPAEVDVDISTLTLV